MPPKVEFCKLQWRLSPESAPSAPTTLTGTIRFRGRQLNYRRQRHSTGHPWRRRPQPFCGNYQLPSQYYRKGRPQQASLIASLSAFFGYTSQLLFDPRVIYDLDYNRWIISAIARPNPPWCKDSSAGFPNPRSSGSYYIYQANVNDGPVGIWDFPQVGLDQNAVIFTANFFNSITRNFIDAGMFAVAKSLLYNGPGQPLTPSMFTGLAGTLTPPLVLDRNPNTYLVAADTGDTKMTLYLDELRTDPPTLSTGAIIPVDPYTVPANAPQLGTTATLDTSDGRFVDTRPP